MATQVEIARAISILQEMKKNHMPGKGKGFSQATSEWRHLVHTALTHDHCASCSHLVLHFQDNKVKIIDTLKDHDPVTLWFNADVLGLSLGQEPTCPGYDKQTEPDA